MPLLKPDPTFYPSPTLATQSPPEGGDASSDSYCYA
jgi:hypothetical protein